MMNGFDKGVLYAAGLVGKYFDNPTIAAFIVNEAGLQNADLSKVDKFDRENLKSLKGEK